MSAVVTPRARLQRAVLLLFLLLAAGLNAGIAEPPALADRIEQIIAGQEAEQAIWGIYVQDIASGRVLYSQNAEKVLMPASNQKLLTTATALDALGSDYRYQTTLFFDGETQGPVLQGDLILEGAGDPTFGSIEADGGDPLRAWARRLAEMGVQRIEGRLIGDDDTFSDRPYAEGWDIDYLTHQSSRALGVSASGLSYNDNVVEIQITATSPGEAPRITMRPTNYLDIRNQLTTSSRRRGISVDTDRNIGTETIILSGSVPRSYRGTIVMPVTNPTTFALHSFKQYLQEAGIQVDAPVVDIDELEQQPQYEDARPLFVHLSPPLAEIIALTNKESNNYYAEQLFRTFGWGGTAEGAERRTKALLSRAGVDTDGLSIRDGSGLSRKDMVTPQALGQLLAYMYRHEAAGAFLASLPEGGERESTLQYRLSGTPVQAKTGSLEYVRALSGYIDPGTAHPLAFVIFANNFTVPSYRVVQTIDRIVMELATARPG